MDEIAALKEAIEYYENMEVVDGSYAQHRRDECLDACYARLEALIGRTK